VAFLTTTFSAPVWLFLLLFITSIPQFLKIYRWSGKSKKAEQIAKKIQMPVKNISSSITDNKFTESMISTVQKLRSLPEEAFKDDGMLSKIKNVAQSAGGAASDGLAAAAKKFEAEMNAKATKPAPKKEEMGKEQMKTIILEKLFKVGDNGRLPQSIASDLDMSKIVTNEYLDELTETNLIAKRKTSLGETYFITKMGKEFCESQGFEK
jgi:predicted transcriptional regulator